MFSEAVTIAPPNGPTPKQIVAYRLRTRDSLNDTEIGEVMGVTRESANRLVAGYLRAASAIREYCNQRRDFSLLSLLEL